MKKNQLKNNKDINFFILLSKMESVDDMKPKVEQWNQSYYIFVVYQEKR